MTPTILGTWKLVSASSSTADGERNKAPFGSNPTGFLTYTPDGRMSAMISFGGRKRLSTIDSTSAPAKEQAEAFSTFLAYAGGFTLRGDHVIHHVEISSIQDWVDTDLIRSIKFEGEWLVLASQPTRSNGKMQTFELIWQRLPANSQ